MSERHVQIRTVDGHVIDFPGAPEDLLDTIERAAWATLNYANGTRVKVACRNIASVIEVNQ